MGQPLLATALLRLAADLEAIRAEWALVGGLAVSSRAEPRTTRDIDVAVAVAGDTEAEAVIERLRVRGYLDETVMDHRHNARMAAVRLKHRTEAVGIFCDLLFATAGIEREVVAEAEVLEVLPGLFAPVARVGHLLALKILALRPGRPQERPQDLADIRELLRVADVSELGRARQALELISRRPGFDRGKDLDGMFEDQLRQFRDGQGRAGG